MGSIAGMNVVVKKIIPALIRDQNLANQPTTSHITD
jgi:hypothetical protein